MVKRTLVIAAAAILAVAPFEVVAKAAGGRPSALSLTSYIYVPVNADGTTDAGAVIANDGVEGYLNNVDSVVSALQTPGGEWELNTRSSATRKMWLTFGADNAYRNLPGDRSYVAASIITHCGNVGATQVGSLTRGTSVTACPATFRFDNDPKTASTYYRIGFNSTVRPGTEYLRFTCTAFGGNASNPLTSDPCVRWEVTPADVDGDGRSFGRLVPVTETKTSLTEGASLGDFPFNFRMVITKP
jgi:hypothetical protein